MRKLLLIVLILFLIMGAVSAQDNTNGTADHVLKDREYNSDIDDDGDPMLVEENGYIPVEINVEEAWSLNVYIDRHESVLNEELDNVTYSHVDIPASVMNGDDEVPLALGEHNIIYEFKFTNTTSIYSPDAYISESGVFFDFNFIRNSKTPQDSIYRFTSQFNIIPPIEPTVITLTPDDIDITHSDSLSFYLKGLTSGEVDIYLDDEIFSSFEIDENPFDDEIDTSKLAIGSYNLVCIVKSENVYAEYNVDTDTSKSMVRVNFVKSKIVKTPKRYITIINTTLNVREIPELNPIYVNAPPIDITYTRSIPMRFVGQGDGDFKVYIDGEKVYDNSIMLSWENTCYAPTKDGEGNYFDVGTHDLSFEFTPSDKYVRFNPQITWNGNALTFDFSDSQDTSSFLNDKYIANTTLKIIDKSAQFIPIESDAVVRIVHTDDINLKIDTLPYAYNLTVFVDDVEIHDSYTTQDTISIKTFFARSSISETNERDIQTGTHKIRFEFKASYVYDVDVSFEDGELHFKFRQIVSDIEPDGVYYQFNTSLIVTEKEKTVHILNVKNHTYFDDTEFIVKMDEYEPEDDDDWDDLDDDEAPPIGTQDVGIIISDENGVVYTGDDLINVYEALEWNHDFENENLPKAGIYTIKIINLADNTYDTAKFEVKKANRIFSKKYTSDDFNVLFTLDFSSCRSDLNSPCQITLNNEKKTINVKKGVGKSKYEVLFNDIDPGTYTATFTLKGNDIYNDVTLKSKVIVKKEAPKITYQKSGGNKLELTIDIGKSKTSGVLTVSAGGQQKKFTVNKNTKHLTVEFDNLASGSYDVEIDFKGNERYTAKTLNTAIEITYSQPSVPEPTPDDNNKNPGKGFGNNSGGIGTGSGDSNALGSGNGTYNGKLSMNGKGFNGDLGSQGSGHGEGAKSYEISKNIKLDEGSNVLLIFLIIAVILLILSFLYERREKDEPEEY
ncbi:hypothetical protein [Methanobrevibacter sp.]|uniref:hypothetical protein n=1 Tax=Methanobrevibacter sp. TaxID=66852 RepID=UPI00386E59FA